MAAKKRSTRRPVASDVPTTPAARLAFALAWLEAKGTQRDLANLARFGITATDPFGVSMANMRVLAKQLGPDHALAAALWESGRYEARMLATLVDEPERVTAAQMDSWCRDFDNWAICDTACFALFDRVPAAWRKIEVWSTRQGEFQKRAAFALLASVVLHDKKSADAPFAKLLPLVEAGARDERNFVKKGVSWALRAVGRRSAGLHRDSVALAQRLAASSDATARWVGKDALRDLTGAVVRKALAKKRAARPKSAPKRSAK